MPVLVNFKICDNDKACNGISVCPKGVFSWDTKNNTLLIDNSKCINCGLCEKSCMVHAIRVARTQEEYEKIQKEFDEDPRTINDLLVERYGAKIIDEPAMLGTEEEISTKLAEAQRPLVVEFFNEDSIACMLKSIPMKKIADAFDKNTRFRKVEVLSDVVMKKYGLTELPSLLFFRNGKLVGKIDGYVDDDSEEEFLEKIRSFSKK